MTADRERPLRVLIAKIGPVGVSETFILDHVRKLPAEVVFHDVLPPAHPLPYQSLARRTGFQGVSYRRYWDGVIAAAKPDVILAEFGETGTSMLGAVKRAAVPLVVHFHGSDAWVAAGVRAQRRTYPKLFRRAAAIVAPSDSTARRLAAIGAPPEKVRVVRCGIDTAAFSPSDPSKAPPHFVGVGRFVPVKGQEFAIRAFATVRQAFPAARLTLVGDGPLRPSCAQLVHDLDLTSAVILPGALPREEVHAILATARGFVHHAVEVANGGIDAAPVAVAEAQAAGLPVVATAIGAVPEMVTDGISGFLVPERDVAATARAMARLATDPALASQLGRAGRERVSVEQDSRRVIAQLQEVLRAAATNPSGDRLDRPGERAAT